MYVTIQLNIECILLILFLFIDFITANFISKKYASHYTLTQLICGHYTKRTKRSKFISLKIKISSLKIYKQTDSDFSFALCKYYCNNFTIHSENCVQM